MYSRNIKTIAYCLIVLWRITKHYAGSCIQNLPKTVRHGSGSQNLQINMVRVVYHFKNSYEPLNFPAIIVC